MKIKNKMKNRYKIFQIISIALIAFGVLSCESYLEEVPQNKLNPTTVTDYRELLNYGYVTKERIMPYLEALGDDVDLKLEDRARDAVNGDAYMSAYLFEPTHETTLGTDIAFARLYQSIYYANLVITRIDEAESVTLGDDMQDFKDNLKGEAYALRAFSYFYLVNLYGQHYDPATASSDFGVPINFSTGAEDKAYPRATVEEVYNLMASDLDNAVNLMEANVIEKTSKIQFNSQSARALQSRVALYMQEWDKTIEAATKVLDVNNTVNDITGLTDMFNEDEYSEYFSLRVGPDYLDADNSNIFFVNGVTENIPLVNYYPTYTTFSVNRELEDLYDEGDIRKYYFLGILDRVVSGIPFEKLVTLKNRSTTSFFGRYQPTSFDGYSRVLRVEEVLLNRAEAYAKNGDLQLAIDDLNAIRVKKIEPSFYTDLAVGSFTQETLIDYIFEERRRELCFEGHRFFDLKRTTRPGMTRTGYKGDITIESTLLQDDPRYVLQIPESELEANPDIMRAPR
ncbi:MAG: RagB/SusD family nutrient uptake outer membrane protein [Polaribacter sp.]|uniref:RagB/SusD family nutrient uptake outer membrane protein n=1 Tax=Polaribacter sp. TaxID=1920175 RepID=UPI003EF876B4